MSPVRSRFLPNLLPLALPLLLLGPLRGAPPASVPVVIPGPGPGASPAQDDASRKKFRDGFEKAQELRSKSEMTRLVKQNTQEAVEWIVDTAERISAAPNDVLFERMSALCEAWGGIRLACY